MYVYIYILNIVCPLPPPPIPLSLGELSFEPNFQKDGWEEGLTGLQPLEEGC